MKRGGQDERLREWPLKAPAVTGVGSLPFSSTRTAHAFVRASCPVVPFVPELLVRRGDGMIAEVARAEDEVVRFKVAATRKTRLVKFQLCGPLTYAAAVARKRRAKRPSAAEVKAAFATVERAARMRIGALQGTRKPLLFVLDEPVLGSLTAAAKRSWLPSLALLFRRLRGRRHPAPRSPPLFIGLHCCSKIDPETIDAIDPDVLSFDATGNHLERLLAAKSTRRWLARGRALALGIVPTRPARGLTSRAIARRIREAIRDAGIDSSPPVLLTGSCGFGLSTPTWTRRAHRLLRDAASELGKEVLA